MRWHLTLPLLLAACSAGGEKGSEQPVGSQVKSDGGKGANAAGCDALRPKVEGLYAAAAKDEAVAANLQTEFVRDLSDMVLQDCKVNPDALIPCIEGASDVRGLESACVLALDDEGTVEGRRFGRGP